MHYACITHRLRICIGTGALLRSGTLSIDAACAVETSGKFAEGCRNCGMLIVALLNVRQPRSSACPARGWGSAGERRDISQDQRYLLWKECAEKSGAWVEAQEAAKQSANAKRSEATKKRERNEDGTLTSTPTSSGDTGAKEKTGKNPGADAKAKSSKTNRGTVERMDKLSKLVKLAS